jgi:glutamate N-acetyltransferase/amino-acid N-acetyltransferase
MLEEVCASLSNRLVADAEGSTRTIHINVKNAVSELDAVEVARACARNNLLKAAIFGGDPNWGRVLAAVGTAKAFMNPHTIDVTLNGVPVCISSAPGVDKSSVSFLDRLVSIDINLNVGSSFATVMTNDLSHDYVHENSAYST